MIVSFSVTRTTRRVVNTNAASPVTDAHRQYRYTIYRHSIATKDITEIKPFYTFPQLYRKIHKISSFRLFVFQASRLKLLADSYHYHALVLCAVLVWWVGEKNDTPRVVICTVETKGDSVVCLGLHYLALMIILHRVIDPNKTSSQYICQLCVKNSTNDRSYPARIYSTPHTRGQYVPFGDE